MTLNIFKPLPWQSRGRKSCLAARSLNVGARSIRTLPRFCMGFTVWTLLATTEIELPYAMNCPCQTCQTCQSQPSTACISSTTSPSFNVSSPKAICGKRLNVDRNDKDPRRLRSVTDEANQSWAKRWAPLVLVMFWYIMNHSDVLCKLIVN